MAHKESTDMILDLLYDELTPEESLRAQKLIAQSNDLQAEFDRLRTTRDEIRAGLNTVLPAQDVPQSLHDSIMAAAAANLQSAPPQLHNTSETTATKTTATKTTATKTTATKTTATEPHSFAPRPPKTTIWSRIANTPRAQFTALATVVALLLTTAVLLRQTNFADKNASFSTASHETTQTVAFAPKGAPAPAATPMEVAAAPAQQAEANEPYEFETASKEDSEAEEKQEMAAEGSGSAGLSDLLNQDSGKSYPRPRRASSPVDSKAAPAPRSVARKPAPTSMPSKKSMEAGPIAKSSPSRKEDISLDSDFDSADSRGGRGRSSSSAPSVSKSAETASRAESEDEVQTVETTPAVTLQDAETALTNRNYAAAIINADSVIANAQSGSNARARALHIKALAYKNQGNIKRANETYQTLQNQHPGYRKSDITRERNALAPRPADANPVSPTRTY